MQLIVGVARPLRICAPVNIHRRPLCAEGRLKGALKLGAAVSRLLRCWEPLHKSGLHLLLLLWFARLHQGKDMIFRRYSTVRLRLQS